MYGKNMIEMRIHAAERIFLIVEVLNHGYGESWMFLRTLRDRKDFSHGQNGYIFQQHPRAKKTAIKGREKQQIGFSSECTTFDNVIVDEKNPEALKGLLALNLPLCRMQISSFPTSLLQKYVLKLHFSFESNQQNSIDHCSWRLVLQSSQSICHLAMK